MATSLWDQVKIYVDEAPAAGFINTNFGKLTVTPIVVRWEEKDGVRAPIKHALKEGEALKDGESLELKFVVNISELNPSLTFEYERTIQIRNNGSQKTDWAEIVLPSLEKVFGKGWASVIETQPYVSVEDANNVAGRSNPNNGKIYQVPRFTARFESKAACEAARELRYHKKDAGEAVAEDDTAPTAEAIKQAVSLIASVGEKKAKKMLEKKPFGNYDADVLFALAMNPDEDGDE